MEILNHEQEAFSATQTCLQDVLFQWVRIYLFTAKEKVAWDALCKVNQRSTITFLKSRESLQFAFYHDFLWYAFCWAIDEVWYNIPFINTKIVNRHMNAVLTGSRKNLLPAQLKISLCNRNVNDSSRCPQNVSMDTILLHRANDKPLA